MSILFKVSSGSDCVVFINLCIHAHVMFNKGGGGMDLLLLPYMYLGYDEKHYSHMLWDSG